MPIGIVQRAHWLEDVKGIGALREKGEEVEVSAKTLDALVLTGQLGRKPPTPGSKSAESGRKPKPQTNGAED